MKADHSELKLPEGWPIGQAPNCAVLTTTHVVRGGHAITDVFHGDHGWQFHYSGEKSVSDAMVIALDEIVALDPTVLEVADIPPGWMAVRDGAGSPWRRRLNTETQAPDHE